MIPPTGASPKTGHYITNGAPFHFKCLFYCVNSSQVMKRFRMTYEFEMNETNSPPVMPPFGALYAFERNEMFMATWMPACSPVNRVERKTATSLAPSQSHLTAISLGSVWYDVALRRSATSTTEACRISLLEESRSVALTVTQSS